MNEETPTTKRPAWERTGLDLPWVFHSGDERIEEIEPRRLQSRDSGFYGAGFYVSAQADFGKGYGRIVSRFAVAPSARILLATMRAETAPAGLLEEIERHARRHWRPAAEVRGKAAQFDEELAMIRTGPLEWKSAVDRFVTERQYDVVMYGDGEIVVKNIAILAAALRRTRRGPTA